MNSNHFVLNVSSMIDRLARRKKFEILVENTATSGTLQFSRYRTRSSLLRRLSRSRRSQL